MKKIIFTLLFISTIAVHAQIDRSKQPKPGPAPKINLEKPQTFNLPNGLEVLVVENRKLPRVSFTLTLDNPPALEGNKSGVSNLMGSLLGKGSKNIEKDAFYEEVDYLGATLNFSPSGGFARSLSKYSDRILELMADAAIHPNFTQEEFDKEKARFLDGLKSQEKSVTTAARRVENVLAYGKNHPYGEFTTQETVNNITLNDVQEFYTNYFVPGNAYLVVVGDVNFEDIKEKITNAFQLWRKAKPLSLGIAKATDAQYRQINFVDMPNAVQSEVTLQNVVDLKMTDKDYFPVLLANKILGGGGEARLFNNLREDKGYTYGAYSSIRPNKYVSRFRASASVRNEVTDSAVVAFLDEINKIRTTYVSNEELANAKAKYIGDFVLALEKPETVARYALNIETRGLPKNFYKNYLKNISAVTPQQIQDAANKYFNINNMRIVVTGKGSDVLENLQKVSFNGKKIPILYYDKYGKSVAKPEYKKATDIKMTAKDIFNNYIKAIGGKEKLAAVESTYLTAEGSVQGMLLNLESKVTTKNQQLTDVKMMGSSLSKQVINGDVGYAVNQGQRKDLTAEEISEAKLAAVPFPELNYMNDASITVEKIENIDGKDAYAIKLSDKRIAFYDVETGLKVQETTKVDANGQEVSITINYGDYKEVNEIKMPFAINQSFGPQKIEFTVKEIKLNEGVTNEDFN